MKKAIKELLENAEQQLSLIQDKYPGIQNNASLSGQGKKEQIDLLLQEANNIRAKLVDDVQKLYDTAITKAQNANRNVYDPSFTPETLCKLKFIESVQDSLSRDEVENLLYLNRNNNVIKRALIPLADKLEIDVDKEDFIFDSADLQEQKEKLLSMLIQIRDHNQNKIMHYSMQMFILTYLDENE